MNEDRAEELFNEHKNLVKQTVYRVFPRPKLTARQLHVEMEDLMQYAYTGLWKACITYDENKGAAFKTHAINHIRWHLIERTNRECPLMKMEVNRNYAPEELPQFLQFDMPMDEGDGMEPITLHEIVDSGVYVEDMAMDDVLLYDIFRGKLKEKDLEILKMKIYGDLDYKEIGKKYGQTGEYMGHIVKKLKGKMKRYLEVV